MQPGLRSLKDVGAKALGPHGAGQIWGRAEEGQASRHGQLHIVAAKGKRGIASEGYVVSAADREDNLEQREAQIGTCAVAGEDDIGSRHGMVRSVG